MDFERLSYDFVINDLSSYLILDVRTPLEFEAAHIPGAYNVPVFSNEERIEIGTTYKQISKENAVRIGLQYFGKQLNNYLEQVAHIITNLHVKPEKILVHCWRGGQRSAAMAWLLAFNKYPTFVLEGGYKSFRNWVLKQFDINYPLVVIGGNTGSYKTDLIKFLETKQLPVINLEELAQHRGSTFGGLGLPKQTSNEMFENKLATSLFKACLLKKPLFIEDESQRIGNNLIPTPFFKTMRHAPNYQIQIDFETRLDNILKSYCHFPCEDLITATDRLQKRLGFDTLQRIKNHLKNENFKEAFKLLLNYYDGFYAKNKSHADFPKFNITYIPTHFNTLDTLATYFEKVAHDFDFNNNPPFFT